MSEILTLKAQREQKPPIEDVLPYFLDGEELNAGLDFISYLRANKLNPRWAGVHSTWNCNYKGKTICYIRLGRKWLGKADNVKWEVSPNLTYIGEYEDEIIGTNMQNYVWEGLSHCRACNNGCAPGANKAILGKNFTGLCYGMLGVHHPDGRFFGRLPISFVNPNKAAIDCIKKLLKLEQEARMKQLGSNQ